MTKRFFALMGVLMLGAPVACCAAIFGVDTLADQIDDDVNDGVCHTSANACSFRAAIMQANHFTGAGVTVINLPAGVYLFTRAPSGGVDEEEGDLNLIAPVGSTPNVVIVGAGAASTIIDANHLEGALRIEAGRTVSIDGVTIRNGDDSGIVNKGTLSLSNCVIEANHTGTDGGGVANIGTLDVARSTIRSNSAGWFGGGLYVRGATRVHESTIDDNGAGLSGGGVFVDNAADHFYGENVTISANYAYGDGGGIYNQAGAFLYNSSVIDNDADHDHDENGGIGGGVYTDAFSRFVIVNTLIARNTERNIPLADDCSGTLEAYGWNLLSDFTGCSISNIGSAGTVSPSTIGFLQDNGGPTYTHALLAGSEAIDTTIGSVGCVDATGAPLATDQRGAERTVGARCDVGAFEYGAVSPSDRIFRAGFE